jgi:protein O-mannosyl-transferase
MAKKVTPVKKREASAKSSKSKNKTATVYLLLIFSVVLTVIAFIPSLNAGFVNWDDTDYVSDNYLLTDWSNLKELLATPVQGNHHPLTMLSLAINYAISGKDAWSYHFLNLLLHVINVMLVFGLARLLSRGNIIIAFTSAILFAVHPMHVESVAWVSERKDVLYAVFFIAGLIAYTKYADTGSKKQYALTFLLLILSLLSKPAAVIFPVSLFCIDLLRKRKLNWRLIAEKIPFFILAAIIGVITFMAQSETGATTDEHFGIGSKILFGFYGIMMYFIKLFIPLQLSPFYPFPPVNESLPVAYYISPLFFAGLAILFFYSLKKAKPVAFGISFYIVNLLLVLQVVSVGMAIIAERYTYVPYIGLFFAIGWLLDRVLKNDLKKAAYILVPVSLLLAFLSHKQSSIWSNSETLWQQAIKHHPSSRAYSALALEYKKQKQTDKALELFNKAIELNEIDHQSYNDRGNIYMGQKKYDLAYADYKKSITIKPDYYTALDNLGALYATLQRYDSALTWLNKALAIKPDYRHAYFTRAITYMKLNRNEEAIKDWQSCLKYGPPEPSIYNSIGICYRMMGKFQESIDAINQAIALDPQPPFYMNRSYAYFGLKNLVQAKQDALIAIQKGVKIDPGYTTSLGIQ